MSEGEKRPVSFVTQITLAKSRNTVEQQPTKKAEEIILSNHDLVARRIDKSEKAQYSPFTM